MEEQHYDNISLQTIAKFQQIFFQFSPNFQWAANSSMSFARKKPKSNFSFIQENLINVQERSGRVDETNVIRRGKKLEFCTKIDQSQHF